MGAALLSELDLDLPVSKDQRTAQKAFLGGKDVFALLLTGFDESLSEQGGTLRHATGR